MIEISLAAEPIFKIGQITITNSVLASWLVVGIISILAIIANFGIKLVPSGITGIFDSTVDFMLSTFESVTGDKKKALEFLPFLGTFFIFIIINNWFGLLPGFGSVTIMHAGKAVPLLRGGNADLNTTIALALISVCSIQYYGMKHLGFLKHWKKYFNFTNPIMGAIGLLELLSEFSKIASFSFRLFGNIFAGEVLLLVIAFLVPVIAPLPFFGLEIFVGLIQAIIFTMLTLVFLSIATSQEAH